MEHQALLYLLNSFKPFFSTDVWRSQCGNDLMLSHGSNRSVGVITLRNQFSGSILHSDCDPSCHFSCPVINYNNILIITTNIYGFKSKLENDDLLESLETHVFHWLTEFPNALLEGDFNIALNNCIDRWPLRQRENGRMCC